MAARRPRKTPLVPPTSSADLGVSSHLVAALEKAGITTPFQLQAAMFADVLAGHEVVGDLARHRSTSPLSTGMLSC